MSHFMAVGIFWIGLNRTDHGCWRLTKIQLSDRLVTMVLNSTDDCVLKTINNYLNCGL